MSVTYTLKCGCVALVELERVVSMCREHNQQWRDLHAQAIADHACGAQAPEVSA
jgi:hypothetical protein